MHQKTHHTPHHLHGIRVLLFGVLLVALFLVRVSPSDLSASRSTGSVLAYATSMNRTDLFNATNSYRAQNGLTSLSMNSQLNTSSQNKGQHMIDNNYWAHIAPDGTQPWYFFSQAGYDYSSAGENLAYGFTTSSATVDAWMNSASHRANILGNYLEVGFGIVNGPSYQGGENTVVVAHYGTQRMAPAAPAPAPVTPTASPPPAPQPMATPTPASPAEATPIPETATPINTESPVVTTNNQKQATESLPPVTVGTSKGVNLFEGAKAGNVSLLAIASLSMTIVAAMGYALTHRSLVRHAVVSGERFALHHPTFDAVTLTVISLLILTTTVGRIG